MKKQLIGSVITLLLLLSTVLTSVAQNKVFTKGQRVVISMGNNSYAIGTYDYFNTGEGMHYGSFDKDPSINAPVSLFRQKDDNILSLDEAKARNINSTGDTANKGQTQPGNSSNPPIAQSGVKQSTAVPSQDLPNDPDLITEGIWFVIQNKGDVDTDYGIPARRLALRASGTNAPVMAQIPMTGNYDEFLWRTIKTGDGMFKLVNKKLGDSKRLDSSPEGFTIRDNGNFSGQTWLLKNTNTAKYGTNAYVLTNNYLTNSGGKAFQYNEGKITSTAKNGDDTHQSWVFQPMELVAGFKLPTTASDGFDRSLSLPYGYKVVASNTVSDWALLNAHLIYKNILGSLVSSQAEKMKNDNTGNKKTVVMISKDNSSDVDGLKTPYIFGTFNTKWMTDYRGGAGSNGITVITEEMMNKVGVYSRGSSDKSYREFEQVVHEFGHATDYICQLNTSALPLAKEQYASAPAEWFPWKVQPWFNSAQSAGGSNRAGLSEQEKTYLSTVFNVENTWLPPRKLRETDLSATQSATPTVSVQKYQPSMKLGDRLQEGEKIVSANGKFQLRSTLDGGFIIEDAQSSQFIYAIPLTARTVNPPTVSFLNYGSDGNIVINSKQGSAYYATSGNDANKNILNKSVRAELTDDGRFVLIGPDGKEIWTAK